MASQLFQGNPKSLKTSLSTEKSSNFLNSVRPDSEIKQHEEILRRGAGDVSVIVRISDDPFLLSRIFKTLRKLAETINTNIYSASY